MPTHEKNDALLVGGYSILPFREMPRPYRLAIARYLAVDGEAWEWPEAMDSEMAAWATENPDASREEKRTKLSEILDCNLDHFTEVYGDMEIGMASVPMPIVQAHVMAVNEDLQSIRSWDVYHAWYKSKGHVPEHSDVDRWPCILSRMGTEAFEDGWHRLHSYAASGHADVPIAFFPDERHLKIKAEFEAEFGADFGMCP